MIDHTIEPIGIRSLPPARAGEDQFGMELPEAKGTYILIARVTQVRRWEIGSLGKFGLIPGFYAYVGSAFGAGGLRARLEHHLAATAVPHWHIDYLLQVANPVEVWYTTAGRKLEHHWAEFLEAASRFRVLIPRFGASDYHRSRRSHLFYSKRRPSIRWFQQQIMERFEGVEVEQLLVCPVARSLERCTHIIAGWRAKAIMPQTISEHNYKKN